jgi:hypothetical protein
MVKRGHKKLTPGVSGHFAPGPNCGEDDVDSPLKLLLMTFSD